MFSRFLKVVFFLEYQEIQGLNREEDSRELKGLSTGHALKMMAAKHFLCLIISHSLSQSRRVLSIMPVYQVEKPGFKGCQVAHSQSQSKKVEPKCSSLASQFVLLTATLSAHKKEKRREAGRKEEDRAEGRNAGRQEGRKGEERGGRERERGKAAGTSKH